MLIAGLTPIFLGKPFSWWQKNKKEIIARHAINPYFSRHTITLSTGETKKQSELLRLLAELGYQKMHGILARGSFKLLGSTLLIYPINEDMPYAVEFSGNSIEDIRIRKEIEKTDELDNTDRKEVDPHKLKKGDYVVHVDHGIGIFSSIKESPSSAAVLLRRTDASLNPPGMSKTVGKEKDLYYIIEYAPARKGGMPDTLHVPIKESKRITLYLGLRTPTIHRLGAPLWRTIKKKAKEDIIQFARALAALYKKRVQAKRAIYYPFPDIETSAWNSFPHEETADQKSAIADIFQDLSKEKPMERLLTGDVGFGKTEVALRAALRVVANGRQVALLSPTTVLADQHMETFTKRLHNLPIAAARLTRLEPDKEIKQSIEKIEKGKIDIVIGTHRIIQKDVLFKNLGLLIIDEEQRFGVKDKETLKERFPFCDILSLSATPIPRTLAFSLAGIRPVSQLKEAPRGRKAPLTNVLPFSEEIIKSALMSEKKRKGQAYYLANRIAHIPDIIKRLNRLTPHMKKGIIHGRMKEKDIIRVMHEFRKGSIDVLISTTIIENGLDISSVNTLIVEDASRLGLGQAHQLRGRIGRGEQESYAYFFYPVRVLSIAPDEKKKNADDMMFLQKPLRHKHSNGAGPINPHTFPQNITSRDKNLKNAFTHTPNQNTQKGVGIKILNRAGTKTEAHLSQKAQRRLNIIEEFSYLGAGTEIARRDLELRGSGNILGREQSGVANKIGWNLYYEMLAEAMEEIKL